MSASKVLVQSSKPKVSFSKWRQAFIDRSAARYGYAQVCATTSKASRARRRASLQQHQHSPRPSQMSQKMLLIGAYANGNIGDMHQADAIAGELLEVDPTLEIFSTSPSKRSSDFPSARHTKLPQSAVRDADVLNSFDLILVGGGGLLAARHAPLPDVEWVQSIRTTLCGLALGCAGEAPEQSRAFIEKCARFSVRDEYSANAVAPIRTDIDIVMDPIFLGQSVDLKVRQPEAAKEESCGYRASWSPTR